MTIGPVITPTITPGSVIFSSSEFLALYPVFTPQTASLQANFNLATLLLNNSAASVVQDAPTRQQLLYLLTAHMTTLLTGAGTNPPTGTVGRIGSATQGSITAQMEWASTVGNAEAFYIQTQWGATAWLMMAPYRTMRYVTPCEYGNSWDAWPQ